MPTAHWQVPGEQIDVSDWPADEEHPFFPEGSRDKRLLRCPHPPPWPWLTAGHRYLFKKSRAVYPDQFWAEVVASRLSRITHVPVPPAYAAWDSSTGECAALIEWFYGYPDDPPQGFLSGGMLLKASIPDFDHERGTQHNFQTIESWCLVLARPHETAQRGLRLEEDWRPAWVRMLAFDALIGNTDRHQENWGFVWTRILGDPTRPLRLSPAFDNGTSLGHERQPDQFSRFDQPGYLQRYIDRGHHHMKWRIDDARGGGHAELLLKFLEKFPQTREVMLEVLEFPLQSLEDAVLPLTRLRLPTPLSIERARFMLTLLEARRDYLLRALAQ
ncbi:MAG: hypothetical protein AMXMBFR37_15240 [Steroidobacteraceae bacterium]